jgi:hypothetical protein
LTYSSEFRNKATTESFDKWLESVVSVGDSGADPKSKG